MGVLTALGTLRGWSVRRWLVAAATAAGGLLTFFAVGCPVCNKLVLLALGYAGAMTWFQPVQPVLQVLAVTLLGLALVQRLRGELACTVSPTPERTIHA